MKRCLFVLIGLLCSNIGAQVKKEIFESFKLQERRNVSYYFPEDYSEEKKYPLVLVLDAEHLFDQVVAISKFNSQFQGMPQTMIVGIEQLENDQRWQDCAFDEENGLPTEKGKLFFEFLGMEIIPSIDTKYSTAPFKMIIGYDITANFMNYWLFKDRSLFNAYISISPLLAPEMESRIPERMATMDKHIFYNLVTAGNRDKITNNILQLDRGLKSLGKENIHYSHDEYPDAGELSVITYGLGKVWERTFQMFKPISPKEYKTEILTSDEPVIKYLEDRYTMIEELFGFEKPIELNDIMAIYAASLKKDDVESLKPLAEMSKKLFPDTMLGFYFEGEYYEKLGEPKKAFKTFEKAFQMEEIDFLTKDMALEKIDALKADFGY